MPHPTVSPANTGSADSLESAFYEALQGADIDKIMACWSGEEEVLCVHPSGDRLLGTAAIRASLEALLGHAGVHIEALHVRKIETLGASVHSVLERLQITTADGVQIAYVMATHVYLHGSLGWRMVARHASPASADDLQAEPGSVPVFH